MASDTNGNHSANIESSILEFRETFKSLMTEVGRVIVGNNQILKETLASFFAGGHVLLEGVPGLGKTLLVKSIANSLGLTFKRIQFTPDLMPSDVTGTQVLTEDEKGQRKFVFRPGPIFANIVLADEINRTTPKTQAALLEAMEEKQLTVLGETYSITQPFFVLATQNPIELEGTYPLPEAQLDRFLVKLLLPLPSEEQLKQILQRTTGSNIPSASAVMPQHQIIDAVQRMKSLVRQVIIAEPLQEVIIRMIMALTPGNAFSTPMVKDYVRFGSGPRGAQAIIMLAKVFALLDGRINVAFEDVQAAITPCLRHRLILHFQAEADSVTTDMIIDQVKNAK